MQTSAVSMLPEVAVDIGADQLTELLTQNLQLFKDKKPAEGPPIHQPDLRWAMLLAIGKAVRPGDSTSIAVLRLAAAEERGGWVVSDLARG